MAGAPPAALAVILLDVAGVRRLEPGREVVQLPAGAGAALADRTPPAFILLRLHADRGLTGELVLRGEHGDVRVYLQAGRIAWASDARRRRGFTERLKVLAGLDGRAVEAVVHACRRSRQPIGEALVARKLASEDQVRAALRHQIADALGEASAEAHPRASFVERAHYATYNARFTFPAGEVLSVDGRVLVPPGAAQARATGGPGDGTSPPTATAMDELKELVGFDGIAGAAVFTPAGEPLLMLDGEVQRLREVAAHANLVLRHAQQAALEMGAGQGLMIHLETERAHFLVRCVDETGDAPHAVAGKAHVHLVVVLAAGAPIGFAKMRIASAARKLAEHFRP